MGLVGAGLWAQEEPARLIFTRSFPGSVPEYTRVEVSQTGEALFQSGRISQPEEPERFQLSPATTAELFRLARELGYFQGLTLESSRSIARMGEKTFIYERREERNEVRFNYTENPQGAELLSWFERIALSRQFIWDLQFAAQFDRLGMTDVLQRFDQAYSQGKLTDTDAFIPILTQVAQNRRLMSLARSHAGRLLSRLSETGPRLEIEFQDTGANVYANLTLRRTGQDTFEGRQVSGDPAPRPVSLPVKLRDRVWELAERFRRSTPGAGPPPLSTQARYRITFEDGPERVQALFTSPPTPGIAELVQAFEQMRAQQKFLARLEEARSKNKFMTQVVLQDLENSVLRNELVDPPVFLPLLDAIANGEDYHELEREIARRIADRIRGKVGNVFVVPRKN